MKIKIPAKSNITPVPDVVQSKFRTEYFIQFGIIMFFTFMGFAIVKLWPVSLIFALVVGTWSLIGFVTRHKIILTENEIGFFSVKGSLIFKGKYSEISGIKSERYVPPTFGRYRSYSNGFQITHLTFRSGDSFAISQNDYENYNSIKRKLFAEFNKIYS